MVAWLRIGVAVGLAALLGACAQLPSAAKLQAFSKAVDNTSDVLAQSIEVNNDIIMRIGDEAAASNYILRRGLADCEKLANDEYKNRMIAALRTGTKNDRAEFIEAYKGVACSYDLPPRNAASLSKEELQVRINLINAIKAYAKALAEASDTGDIEKLEGAATTLSAAAATAFTPLLGSVAVPIISPASKLVVRGLGLAVGNAYAVEIRTIMARTELPLQNAVTHLKRTTTTIKRSLDTNYNVWRGIKKLTLEDTIAQASNNFGSPTRSAAYRDFRDAAAEVKAVQAKMSGLKNAEQTLDALLKAHAGLMKSDENADADLGSFIKLSDELAAFGAVVKK